VTSHWLDEVRAAVARAQKAIDAAAKRLEDGDFQGAEDHMDDVERHLQDAYDLEREVTAAAENATRHAASVGEEHGGGGPKFDEALERATALEKEAQTVRGIVNPFRRRVHEVERTLGNLMPRGYRRDPSRYKDKRPQRTPKLPKVAPSWWPRWIPRWLPPGLGSAMALAVATGLVVSALGSPNMPLENLGNLLPGLDGWSWGDTHLATFDGLLVDVQAVGEFVLIRSDDGDLEVQVRQQPVPDSRTASLNTAVAMNVAGDHVSLDSAHANPLLVNGEATEVPSEGISLPNGGRVSFDGGSFYSIAWPDGSAIRVPIWDYEPKWMEVRASLADSRAGTVEGLLGNGDGDPTNDLRTADGTELRTDDPSFNDVYDVWIHSWRISRSDSLFTYGAGTSTETFTDVEFPDELAAAGSLSPEERQGATRVCRDAGVTMQALLETCVLDVAVTGVAGSAEATVALESAWTGASQELGHAHLQVTGEVEGSIDLSFDADGSSNPPDGSFMILHWENDQGQRVTIGTSRFTGTRAGVQIQMQLVAGRPGFSHVAFGNECDVTFTTADADRVAGTLSCTFSDVVVQGTFDASF
jgi:hypothetical protein